MKYTIEGFSQAWMITLKMDCQDAIFLRWFADFIQSGKMKTLDVAGHTYYWLKYDAVVEELPILGIEKRQLGTRLKALCDNKILGFHLQKAKDGTHTYFRIMPDSWNALTSSTTGKTVVGTTEKTEVRTAGKTAPIDSSSSLNSSPNSSTTIVEPSPKSKPDEYSREFLLFWGSYPRKEGKRAAWKCWNSRLKEGVSPDDMQTAAYGYARKCDDTRTEAQFIKLPQTFIGPNRPYEDFVTPMAPEGKREPEDDEKETDRQRSHRIFTMIQENKMPSQEDLDWALARGAAMAPKKQEVTA